MEQADAETDEYRGLWAAEAWQKAKQEADTYEQHVDQAIRDIRRFGASGERALEALQDSPDILDYIQARRLAVLT